MRIIGGQWRGRRLKTPTWDGLRPTSDKLRETLFNIIATRVPDARVLDVCAGTGAVGLEALSRGAASAAFIDADRRAVALIDTNAELCGARDRCVIIRDTAEHALHNRIDGDPFDLVMIDPPYEFTPLTPLIDNAALHLAAGGLLILEHATRCTLPAFAAVTAMRTVRSGDSSLTLFAPR
ncbi:MAG TPA: 16S rRNA (guanine(966)-N(2))-methyltransferase RsmD [Vicinamibacterales bacterium]|nr:16S rRNA (guanine(966)-N(2))-methyltransferase RsmD [Vicinamibacterales bacterium]